MQSDWTKLRLGLCLSTAVAISATGMAADSWSSQQGSVSSEARSSSHGYASRSISLNENGRHISITEDSSGITVTTNETADGRQKKAEVKAANARELKQKNPEAYRLYESHLGQAQGRAGARGNTDARELLRNQLRKEIKDNAENPQMKALLEKMLGKLDELPVEKDEAQRDD